MQRRRGDKGGTRSQRWPLCCRRCRSTMMEEEEEVDNGGDVERVTEVEEEVDDDSDGANLRTIEILCGWVRSVANYRTCTSFLVLYH